VLHAPLFDGQLAHLYLTQALLYGVGAAAVYFPIITLTPLHFNAHRGLALGIITSGAGFGGLVLAPIIRVLISRTGIRWALRWLGLLNFGVTFPLSFIVKSHGGKAGSTQLVNLRVARRKVFVFEVLIHCSRNPC
jgi:MFS family permease